MAMYFYRKFSFDMLNGGGSLLVPNLTHNVYEAGYMEAFMDWHMIYRESDDMNRLVSCVHEPEISSKNIFKDPWGNIIFFELTKA
ncbi:hypothetical protein CCP2SC5_330022 [Azospirillaceae bacterium]